MSRIPLIKPFIPEDAIPRIAEVLNSGQLTEGAVTREFERVFREYVGSRHALAVCNCTVGLEVALRAMGIGPGDEVVVPDYTYPASASAVTMLGATAVLADVDPDTMLLSESAVHAALTRKTKAVMPVSIFGNPFDYAWLHPLQQQHGFRLIEDAACSIGAAFGDRKVGTWADISVFSLHPRKFITTGEGGMITTDNAEWATWMDSYKHFGMSTQGAGRDGIVFERFGTNYKLSNLLAALGLSQMAHVHALLQRRQELAARYYELLRDRPGIAVPNTLNGGRHSFQTCCVFVRNRNDVLSRLRADDIEVQIGTFALHRHPAYRPGPLVRHAGDFPGSRRAADEALALPLFHEMTFEQQDRVVAALTAAVR
jgi:perosamine synthetase